MKSKYLPGKYYVKIRGRGVCAANLTPNQAKVMFQLVKMQAFEIEGVSYGDSLSLE